MLLPVALALFLFLPLVLASPTHNKLSQVIFPAENDWWVIGAENTLVFNWTAKGGEPVTTLYNLNTDLMEAPFFWESIFNVQTGMNVVKSDAALVGAKPGHGYYLTIDVKGKHLTSHTFEIRANGSAPRAVPEVVSSAGRTAGSIGMLGTVSVALALSLAGLVLPVSPLIPLLSA